MNIEYVVDSLPTKKTNLVKILYKNKSNGKKFESVTFPFAKDLTKEEMIEMFPSKEFLEQDASPYFTDIFLIKEDNVWYINESTLEKGLLEKLNLAHIK